MYIRKVFESLILEVRTCRKGMKTTACTAIKTGLAEAAQQISPFYMYN